MSTTNFSHFNPLDNLFNNGPSSFGIETEDNGHHWHLRLFHIKSGKTMDIINLERKVTCKIDPVWFNHKVTQQVYNAEDWLPSARAEVKANIDKINSQSLFDFLVEHTKTELELEKIHMDYMRGL